MQILSMSLNHIDMCVKMGIDAESWRCTGVYGLSEAKAKPKTCELIDHLANTAHMEKWLIFGDFNLILS